MAITLVTGKPGAGKTLWALGEVLAAVRAGRVVFCNVDGLDPSVGALPVGDSGDAVADARAWETLPDGALIVLDECQRAFPPRNSMAAVPAYISGFETHRHRALDFVLITQGPRLIDRHLHDLIDRHVHLFRVWGMRRAVVSELGGVNLSPDPVQDRRSARRKVVSQDKRLFGLYDSAVEHTDKRRLPWAQLLGGLGGLCLVVGGGWWAFGQLRGNGGVDAAISRASCVADGSAGDFMPAPGRPPGCTVVVFGGRVIPRGCEAVSDEWTPDGSMPAEVMREPARAVPRPQGASAAPRPAP
jgi:zona occludens toxin